MWLKRLFFPVFAALGVIVLWRRFRKGIYGHVADRKSIPATLLKHAQACKRNIHEVPGDDNSLFSALADQLTDATCTGQSLRDHIETFISGRRPSEKQESLMLSNPNTGPTIQDAADFLRHPIVLYRDDDNPPFFFQPKVDGPDPSLQILHIGYINKYYVSFRPHDYNKRQGASVPVDTDSDKDGSDTDSEIPRALITIGDENKTTIVAPGDAERPISLAVINRGNNNRVALNIIVSENLHEYVDRMIASDSSVGDEGIHMKIKTSGIGQEEIDRAERNVIKNKIKIQDNINDAIGPLGVRLSMLGLGCLLMCFRPKSWLNCRAFITGLRLHNEKYLDIFRQLLTAFQHINDSNNLTMDVKISIGQLSDGTDLSDFIRGTESRDIFDRQARTIDKTPHSLEKKAVGKKQTTTDPRSGRSVGKEDTLSLKVVKRPVGNKSSLSSTDLKKVAVRTVEQVSEFKEADASYIPHTKTHDRMTTIQFKEADVSYIPHTKTHNQMTTIQFKEADVSYIPHTKTHDRMTTILPSYGKYRSRPHFSSSFPSYGKYRSRPDFSSSFPSYGKYRSRPDFSSSFSETAIDVSSDSESDADSDPSLLAADIESRSGSKRKVKSVLSYGLNQLRVDSSKSSPSLSNADKKLRSLLIKNLSDAVQQEFARLQRLSINDPDIDGALNTMEFNVFVISSGNKQLGTAFSLGHDSMLTAGHVIGGSKGKYLQVRNELCCMDKIPIGISSIADVGVLQSQPTFYIKMPEIDNTVIDFGTESCTYIYVVGYVDGNRYPQGEKCPVLPPRDKDDGYIRFQSKLFHEGSSGSPCLVFKDGEFVVKGILVGREEGTNMPYELIAITFRCLWKRLGLPLVF